MQKYFLKIAVFLVVIAFVFVGVSTSVIQSTSPNNVSNSVTKASTSGTFIFGSPVDTSVADLNPMTTVNSLATILVKDMYATTLAYEWPDGNLTAWLASSWTIVPNANGTETITFNLNPNAEWVKASSPDGQITTSDVLFTFEALKDNQSLDTNGIGLAIKSITVVNKTVITFLLRSQSTIWLDYIGTQVIIPQAWSAYDNGNPGNIGSYKNMGPYSSDITAGPFYLSTIISSGAKLLPNSHFWMGVPNIGTYYVEKFTSSATADLALEEGAISAVNPALSDFNALTGKANITNLKSAEPYVFYLWMNDHVTPFNNVDFRIGMSYALNKRHIMSRDEDGIGQAGPNNMSFGGLPGVMKYAWASNLTYYNYNISMAKSYFEKAGYHIPTGSLYFVNNTTNKQVTFNVQEPSAVSDWVASGTTIASELQAAGIDAQVQVIPIGTWVTDDLNTADFTQTTYFGYVPPATNPYIQLECAYEGFYNSTGKFVGGLSDYENYSNSVVNHYLNLSEHAPTLPQLIANLSYVQQVLDKQVPMIPMSNAFSYVAYNSARVTGEFKNMSIDDPLNLIKLTVVSSPPVNSTFNSVGNDLYYYIGGGAAAVVVIAAVVAFSVRKRKGNKEEK